MNFLKMHFELGSMLAAKPTNLYIQQNALQSGTNFELEYKYRISFEDV